MNRVLWVLQAILAVMFLMAGGVKTFSSVDQLMLNMPWIASTGEMAVRLAGVSEVAGAFGLILPGMLKRYTFLTPLAALGLTVVMVLAAALHFIRGEVQNVVLTLGLACIAGFVAYGRWKLAPLSGNKKSKKK